MQNNGWIKIYRKFTDWQWLDKPEMVSLFLYLLLSANHEDGKWQGQEIKRGQFITGLYVLKGRLGISIQSLRTCLSRLQATGEITRKTTNKFSIITIVKYNDYQINDSKLTNKQQTTNKQLTTNKKNKNIRSKEEYNTNTIFGEQSSPPTPKDMSIKFFEMINTKETGYEEFIKKLCETTKISEETAKKEVLKFTEYWTELNATGKKQRWEKEKVFEVKRRLTFWLNNSNKWSSNNSNKKQSIIL